jgi:phospholipid-binding lipoprotein MlaA
MKKLLISLVLLICASFAFANEEDVDKFEGFNREVHEFNQALDDKLLRPIAVAYKDNTPEFAQNRITDFFANLRDVITLANQILQFKFKDSTETAASIIFNTTFGLAGLFDISDQMGIKTKREDAGQTLAHFGVPQGPYLVMPFLGPTTVRGILGSPIDSKFSQTSKIFSNNDLTAANVTNIVNIRAQILPITDAISRAEDPYTAIRSGYLQKLKFDVFDGNVPIEDDDF